MSMNPTNIEWCSHSWNPFTGCCHLWNPIYKGNPLIRACEYCYAVKTAENKRGTPAFPNGFEPTFHANRLEEPRLFKKPSIIFADSMSDAFGDWWKECEIYEFLEHVWQAKHHKFVILTKNPERMKRILVEHYEEEEELFSHVYFGTSVTGLADGVTFLQEASRLCALGCVHEMGFKTVISFEPLLGDPAALIAGVSEVQWADWIIIGGQTGPVKIPEYHWVKNILKSVPLTKPIFIKENAGPEWFNKEFPADLLPIAKSWGKA
ncbi:MAG: DUF5131 family protein [Candidatus Paceibacterota bacterium]